MCRARDRRFPMLFMAPEGTCGSGRCVLRFRTGAFVPGAPVLPVALAYNKAHHNPAWTIMHLGWHFVRAPYSRCCHAKVLLSPCLAALQHAGEQCPVNPSETQNASIYNSLQGEDAPQGCLF